jgi:hypothetical protein
MSDSIIGETERCVECFEPRTSVCGHVVLGDNHVLAGWCSKHMHIPGLKPYADPPGYFGTWDERMGLEPYGPEHYE